MIHREGQGHLKTESESPVMSLQAEGEGHLMVMKEPQSLRQRHHPTHVCHGELSLKRQFLEEKTTARRRQIHDYRQMFNTPLTATAEQVDGKTPQDREDLNHTVSQHSWPISTFHPTTCTFFPSAARASAEMQGILGLPTGLSAFLKTRLYALCSLSTMPRGLGFGSVFLIPCLT